MSTKPHDLRREVLDQLRWTVDELTDEVARVGPGWLARTRSLPLVHTLNRFHVTEVAGAAEILAVVEEHQRDLPYRHVVVDDEGTARELWAALGKEGWRVERDALMVLAARASREIDTSAVTELSQEETEQLMRRWAVEDHLDTHEGVLEQLARYNRREGALWNERLLGIRAPAGQPAALTKLRRRGATAWVEHVYTVPEQRGRGHARALVTYAANEARAEDADLTFIIADDDDWPKHLYADVGFRLVGTSWSFHKEVGDPAR
ncbi:MAG: GNAT family N-acetyltransferase [Actinomycetota bacterium]|nr:GNAT family N-acetyltransferase [Actinomycetota bacterium]